MKTNQIVIIVVGLVVIAAMFSIFPNISVEENTEPKWVDEIIGETTEADLREGFMDGCMITEEFEEYCECAIDELLKDFSKEEIIKGGISFAESEELPDGFIKAMLRCSDLIY